MLILLRTSMVTRKLIADSVRRTRGGKIGGAVEGTASPVELVDRVGGEVRIMLEDRKHAHPAKAHRTGDQHHGVGRMQASKSGWRPTSKNMALRIQSQQWDNSSEHLLTHGLGKLQEKPSCGLHRWRICDPTAGDWQWVTQLRRWSGSLPWGYVLQAELGVLGHTSESEYLDRF